MCQAKKKQEQIDDLIDKVNDVFLALANIRVSDSDSRQLRQDALVSTIIIRANLVELGVE